jgi:D-alanyl-D-alanine carboxypeptidase (penicillin-binding protein 5/6)
LTDPVRVSERAALTGGSRLGLRGGDIYPLGELMKAALIKSANDAAVAVAEKVAGSTEGCVRMMNDRAQSLGMTHTTYNTVDGLPPRPGQDVDVTNAYDLATLGRTLIQHTDLLQWSGMESALFNDGTAVLHNTNHLVGHFEGCDGLKTGFTFQAGFNLTATAKRGDMRLIAVVLGAPSNGQRFAQAAHFLQWGFDNFTRVVLLKQGQALPVHVQVQSGQDIQPIAQSEVDVVVPKSSVADIKVEYEIQPVVSAPLANGAPLGEVVVRDGNSVVNRVAAVSPGPVNSREGILDYLGSGSDGGLYRERAIPAPVAAQQAIQ